MRILSIAGPLVASFTAFAVYGCVLDVNGLEATTSSTSGETSSSSGGGAGPSSASTSSGQVSGAGGMGGNSTSITSSSVSTGCASQAEICDDGIDNNCDGKLDCEDPQCTDPTDGRSCVDDPPSPWTVVSVATGASGTCPTGYDGLGEVSAPSSSSASECACSCGQAPNNPCLQGMLSIQMGMMGCGGDTFMPDVTGDCDLIGAKVGSEYKTADADVLPPGDIACPGTPMKPGQQPGAVSTTCAPTTSAAGGCKTGATCLPKLATATLCIQSNGDVACPSGAFPNRQVVGVPGDEDDQRSCGSCACESSATSCSNAKFTGYDDAACNTHPVSVTLDGTCHAVNMSTFKNNSYFKYQATPNTMSCAPSGAPPALNGGFALKNPITICCP